MSDLGTGGKAKGKLPGAAKAKGVLLKAGSTAERAIGQIPVIKRITNLTGRKKTAAYVALILVFAVPASYAATGLPASKNANSEFTEYIMKKGNVQVSISGSGTVAPIEQYEIRALVEGDVLQDTFSEGDDVQEGDTLYVIDAEEMENSLEKANISLEKQQISYKKSLKSYGGLTVTSPIKGMIDEIYVSKGDTVQAGSKIAKVIATDTMSARVPFSEIDAEGLYVGQPVDITVENTFEQLTGKITKIYNSKRVIDGSITVTDVEVAVENPGYLQTGTYISVTAGSAACYAPAPLEAASEKIVTAETSGTVETVNVEGAYLNAGEAIATLDNEDASDELKSSQLSLRESELSYENTQKQLDNYTITAPISGSVISKTVKAGDTLDENGTVMAVIADMSTITFEISVDELDIASMKVGQEVNITADALPDEKFTGYVDNIGLLGASAQGVTSYPVTIVINEPEGLWPGMNVTADIIIDSAQDVLVAPIDAVSRGNTVNMKDGTKAEVEIGLNDDSYIEIKSGLQEGDIILVPARPESASSSQAVQGGPMNGGGMPGANGGGGMPNGGSMPSGSGGNRGGGPGGM